MRISDWSSDVCSSDLMHCFTESWEMAQAAMDLNFHISLSGIVTFKNASIVHEVATKMPLDRLLIETDSPYLAPVPFRGKRNDPSKVIHVAEKIADLQGIEAVQVRSEEHTSELQSLMRISYAVFCLKKKKNPS